ELGNVVGTAPAFTGGARPFPAAEGLRAGPGAGSGAGTLVGVADAGFDLVEEALHLAPVSGKDTRGEAILHLVCLGERLVQALDLAHGEERHEQLLAVERALQGQLHDRGRNEVAPV